MPLAEAKVPVLDRGFIFGDGVYEVVPVYSKVPFRLEEHLNRLERSLGAVGIRNPYTREQWRGTIAGLIERQPFEDQGVYFQVTRGVAKLAGCAATSSRSRSSVTCCCASFRPRPMQSRRSFCATAS